MGQMNSAKAIDEIVAIAKKVEESVKSSHQEKIALFSRLNDIQSRLETSILFESMEMEKANRSEEHDKENVHFGRKSMCEELLKAFFPDEKDPQS